MKQTEIIKLKELVKLYEISTKLDFMKIEKLKHEIKTLKLYIEELKINEI